MEAIQLAQMLADLNDLQASVCRVSHVCPHHSATVPLTLLSRFATAGSTRCQSPRVFQQDT